MDNYTRESLERELACLEARAAMWSFFADLFIGLALIGAVVCWIAAIAGGE